jgi:hypothetical protein
MGKMTVEQLKQKYGTEGIRVIAAYFRYDVEEGIDIRTDGLDLMLRILEDVGNMLTEDPV